MAFFINSFARRASISVIRSATKSSSRSRSPSFFKSQSSSLPPKSPSSPTSRFTFTRSSSELGCVQSLLPLSSAVALSRMAASLTTTSRSCSALSQGS